MTTRCTCCDLPRESCGKAAEDRARAERFVERTRLLAQPGWIAASYPGFCSRCYDRIDVGQPIARWKSGWRCCE